MKTLATALLFAASAAAQAGPWAQCGGQGHTGATTCVSGHYCSVINAWYSQCLPGTAPGGPPPPPPTTPVPPPPPVTTASPPTTTPPTAPPPPVAPGTCPALPSGLGPANANLPNPFVFQNGAAITTKADWACRQREISAQIQTYELGTLPGKPQSVTGSYSGNRLTINVSDQGRSISFAVTINKPSGTNVPAIIAKQWEALGALDNFGYSQVGGNSHCSFPAAKQGSELTAFINKFLLQSGGGTTSIFRTEKNHGSFNLNTWASWSVPTLT
ncbi:4-O-methyl-glucuronoyl methylesterase 1 like protein [Verticillium longisporum]|nr:4-O-methyl-glucuronoyl methylesterase 1 like protein [Verticillium longisporum]